MGRSAKQLARYAIQLLSQLQNWHQSLTSSWSRNTRPKSIIAYNATHVQYIFLLARLLQQSAADCFVWSSACCRFSPVKSAARFLFLRLQRHFYKKTRSTSSRLYIRTFDFLSLVGRRINAFICSSFVMESAIAGTYAIACSFLILSVDHHVEIFCMLSVECFKSISTQHAFHVYLQLKCFAIYSNQYYKYYLLFFSGTNSNIS